ncbi:MAG: hypothetical protein QXJ55_08170 [Candidatus Caldarchaeum sp.]
MLVRIIFRMMVVAFFSMTWVFLVLPLAESTGISFGQTEKILSFIAVPLIGLLTAQIMLRLLRRE